MAWRREGRSSSIILPGYSDSSQRFTEYAERWRPTGWETPDGISSFTELVWIAEMGTKQLPDFPIRPTGEISEAFLESGVSTFHRAVGTVRDLPYGRTSHKTRLSLVLEEERGTCSTKHALLAQLATEQGVDSVRLTLGVYEMDEQNTPGVGRVLSEHGLDSILEAHCYLTIDGRRYDFTEPDADLPVDELLYEEQIRPSQIGDYKARLHRRRLAAWGERNHPGRSTDELWAIREACIAALER